MSASHILESHDPRIHLSEFWNDLNPTWCFHAYQQSMKMETTQMSRRWHFFPTAAPSLCFKPLTAMFWVFVLSFAFFSFCMFSCLLFTPFQQAPFLFCSFLVLPQGWGFMRSLLRTRVYTRLRLREACPQAFNQRLAGLGRWLDRERKRGKIGLLPGNNVQLSRRLVDSLTDVVRRLNWLHFRKGT